MTKNRFLSRFEFQSTSNFDLHFSAKESKENCSKTVLPLFCKSRSPCLRCFYRYYMNKGFPSKQAQSIRDCLHTPPIAEIIWVKNVRAIVVCGFLKKSLKKLILKI